MWERSFVYVKKIVSGILNLGKYIGIPGKVHNQIKNPKICGRKEKIVSNIKSFLFIEVRVLSLSSVTIY